MVKKEEEVNSPRVSPGIPTKVYQQQQEIPTSTPKIPDQTQLLILLAEEISRQVIEISDQKISDQTC